MWVVGQNIVRYAHRMDKFRSNVIETLGPPKIAFLTNEDANDPISEICVDVENGVQADLCGIVNYHVIIATYERRPGRTARQWNVCPSHAVVGRVFGMAEIAGREYLTIIVDGRRLGKRALSSHIRLNIPRISANNEVAWRIRAQGGLLYCDRGQPDVSLHCFLSFVNQQVANLLAEQQHPIPFDWGELNRRSVKHRGARHDRLNAT